MLPPSTHPCGMNVPGKKFGEFDGKRMGERWMPKEIHIYSQFFQYFYLCSLRENWFLATYAMQGGLFSPKLILCSYPQIYNN